MVVIEGMNLSGHPWIINEMRQRCQMSADKDRTLRFISTSTFEHEGTA